MPRRCIDYADSFTSWHALSRFGSLISFVRLLVFLLILVEGLGSQRSLICCYYLSSRREWKWCLYPICYHGLSENPAIFQWFKSKKKKFVSRLIDF